MTDELLAEEFEHAGLTVKIHYESYIEDWMNPRADCDGILGVMVVEYRNYILGGGKHDENEIPEFEIDCRCCEGSGEDPDRFVLIHRIARCRDYRVGAGSRAAMESERDLLNNKPVDGSVYVVEADECSLCKGMGVLPVDPVTYFKQARGARVVLPLSIYEHSGITMFVGHHDFAFDPGGWDTSYVGFCFDTPETREECGWEDKTDDEIEAELRNEIKEYDRYLRNEVFFVEVVDHFGQTRESVGGLIGSEYAEQEGRSMAEAERKYIDNKVMTEMVVLGEN